MRIKNQISADHDEVDWSELQTRGVVELSSKAIVNNYLCIREQAKGKFILPMIKADAYGHGMKWAADQLKAQPDLFGFGVASLEEAYELRQHLGIKGRNIRILALSGCANWSQAKGELCQEFKITPVIASDSDWQIFWKQEWPKKLDYHLKFNTGMNRLGMSLAISAQVAKQIEQSREVRPPEGVLTHMACAEDPEHPLSKLQFSRFRELRSVFSRFQNCLFHCANSSTIWNSKYYPLDGLNDIVRPGISLYGVPPWKGAADRGLQAVMQIKYGVILRRTLKEGESLGYGASFRVREKTFEVAIPGAGYADGLHRIASNEGYGWLNRSEYRFMGRVSMDLSAIACEKDTKVGDWVYVLGQGIDPWRQAEAMKTIPYELLTSASARLERIDTDRIRNANAGFRPKKKIDVNDKSRVSDQYDDSENENDSMNESELWKKLRAKKI